MLGCVIARLRHLPARSRLLLKRIVRHQWVVFAMERLFHRRELLRLHLGCGHHLKPGFINIDVRPTEATDLVCNITRLPFRPKSVERIELFHVIEHLPKAVAERALARWFELLTPGGVLVIECPDFDLAVKDYLAGNFARLHNIFGRQSFPSDFHLWGWNAQRLEQLLKATGFSTATSRPPMDYHVKTEPCLRVEAVK